MKKAMLGLLIGATVLLTSGISSTYAASPLILNQHVGLAKMLAHVTPTIVNITVEKSVETPKGNPFNPSPEREKATKMVAIGSGVIINADEGIIVTNAHVVKNQRMMLVTVKDGRRYRAKLIGSAPGFDIAVIQIHAKHLTAVSFADSDQLKVGDFVAAIGSPYGLKQSVTSGVVSALNRAHPKIEGYQSFIQTDAPINPGNSGGALVSMSGQLVGINTAIFTPSAGNIGIGFAIPSNMVESVAKQLLKYGKVKRGILGVLAQNLTPQLATALKIKNTHAVIVTQVVPGSPAAKAGLKPEDIIETVNNRKIRTSTQLRNTLGLMRPGTGITIHAIRNHKAITLKATVGNPKTILKQSELPFIGGLRLQSFNELEGDGRTLNGVLVAEVPDTSAGALAGLQFGDIILTANGKKVTTPTQVRNIAESKPRQLLLKIARGNSTLYIVVEPS